MISTPSIASDLAELFIVTSRLSSYNRVLRVDFSGNKAYSFYVNLCGNTCKLTTLSSSSAESAMNVKYGGAKMVTELKSAYS